MAKRVTNRCAPVIDAEKLARRISGMSMYWELDNDGHTTGIEITVISEEDALALITDSTGGPHTPVIDAERLAEKINKAFGEPYSKDGRAKIARIITDSRDLDITWVDGKAEWGEFTLKAWQVNRFGQFVSVIEMCDGYCEIWTSDYLESQELAQQACVDALRRIVTGGKG